MVTALKDLVDASTAYSDSQRDLDGLRSQQALLVAQIDELNTKIAALVPVVQASKEALKAIAGTL